MNEFIYLSLGILVVAYIMIIAFALLTGISTFKTGGAMFATTHSSMIEMVLGAVTMLPDQVVYDLGCGDGRFLIAAVKKYKVKAIGFEINPWAYVLSKLRVKLRSANVSVHFKNFWNADLSSADFVFCYLFPDVMERLKEKLTHELKSGAKVISCNFGIPGWRPEEILTASHQAHNDPIFIYIKK